MPSAVRAQGPRSARLITWAACAACAAWAAGVAVVSPSSAQDVRDVVRDHLERELAPRDRPARTHKPHKPAPRRATSAKPRRHAARTPAPTSEPGAAAVHLSMSAEPKPVQPAAPTGPALPRRVLDKYLQLDVNVGGGYRGWLPQQFPHVNVAVGTYYVWTVDVRAKLFNFISLHRGYYESNSLAGPRTQEAAVASQVGTYIPKAAWILGVLGFPWFKVWEPILRYESRAFHTEARPREPVCVVNDAVAGDLSGCERTRKPLRITSGFETFVAGVRYDQGRDPERDPSARTLPPITFGVGLLSYRKPYQVNVNGNTLDGYLFDGRFRGAGVHLGLDLDGSAHELSLNVYAQLGLGEVKLTPELSLNSLAPEDWLMGYVIGNASLGYSWPLYSGVPTLMFVPRVTLGGASFFFFKTTAGESRDRSSVATANWDLLWSVHASLVVSL